MFYLRIDYICYAGCFIFKEMESFEETEKRRKNALVYAAIDFGTTYSGYAYAFRNYFEETPPKVIANSLTARDLSSLKVPTILLLDSERKFIAFGCEAEDKYVELAQEKREKNFYYFRRFKMKLYEVRVRNYIFCS